MPVPDDASLLDACRRGDDAAWTMLVERHGGLVRAIPRRYGLPASDADDVTQATFLALHRSIDRVRDGQALPAWLMTTAHRETWRIGRERGRRLDLARDFENVQHPAEDVLADGEDQALIRRAMEQLEDRCRTLLERLYAADRPPYETIAREFEMPVGSIGPTRARCLDRLRRIAERLGLTAASPR